MNECYKKVIRQNCDEMTNIYMYVHQFFKIFSTNIVFPFNLIMGKTSFYIDGTIYELSDCLQNKSSLFQPFIEKYFSKFLSKTDQLNFQ